MQIGGVADELEAAEPSHIADLVSYLAKPETSYVTGAWFRPASLRGHVPDL